MTIAAIIRTNLEESRAPQGQVPLWAYLLDSSMDNVCDCECVCVKASANTKVEAALWFVETATGGGRSRGAESRTQQLGQGKREKADLTAHPAAAPPSFLVLPSRKPSSRRPFCWIGIGGGGDTRARTPAAAAAAAARRVASAVRLQRLTKLRLSLSRLLGSGSPRNAGFF